MTYTNETNVILQNTLKEAISIELYSRGAKQTDIVSGKDLFMKLAYIKGKHKKMLEDATYYLDQGGPWYGYSPPTLEG